MKFKHYFWRRFFSSFVIFTVILHTTLPALVLAEDPIPSDSPAPTVTEQTTPAENNNAAATTDTNETVNNDNNVDLNNNVDVNGNSGNNSINSSPNPSASPTEENYSILPTPTPLPDASPTNEASPLPSVTPTDIVDALLPSPDSSILPDVSPTLSTESTDNSGATDSAVLCEQTLTDGTNAVNANTPDNSNNSANSTDASSVTVNNNNDTNLDNKLDANANTGNNDLDFGKELETGSASAEINASNIVNTNLTGSDFLYALINLIAASENDLDLSKMDMSMVNPELVSIMAQNQETGTNSINVALANLISAFAVYNQNNANLTNNICADANTGDNTADGNRTTINTGTASASVNLFNMVNTNLTGSDWFFAIINLFKSLNGDIILPYELDYLGATSSNNTATAVNQDTEDGSVNQSIANVTDSTTVNNDNDATINNNLDIDANSGNNTIDGTGTIKTGVANASADLTNLINTNITGSRWLLVIIQNLGNWEGTIEGWWGNLLTVGNLTFAWVQMPGTEDDSYGQSTLAMNNDTGDGSVNQSIANISNSTSINNDNDATINNNITVSADSGNNTIDGNKGTINTGGANASANVANVANTNIYGNHWYFSLITIFDNFIGNIIFPRPDLTVIKSADRNSVHINEELTYTIAYANQGKVGASNVTISDNLPNGMSFVSASGNPNVNGSQIVWSIGQVASKQIGTVTITVKINVDNGSLTNNVSISTSTDEPNKDNNVGGASVNITGNQSNNNSGSNNNNNNNNGSNDSGSDSSGTTETAVVVNNAAANNVYYAYGYGTGGAEVEASPQATPQPEVLGESIEVSRPICWWWLILSVAGLVLTSGMYAIWGMEKPKFWYLMPIVVGIATYIGDQTIAHQYFQSSKMCDLMWLWSGLQALIPSVVYKKVTG